MKDSAWYGFSKMCSGDPPAWNSFVKDAAPVVYTAVARVFFVHCGRVNAHDTEETVQDVFCRLIKDDYRLIKTYDPQRASLSTWLTVVSRSVAIDGLRARRQATVALDGSEAEEIVENATVEEADPESLDIPDGLLTPQQQVIMKLLTDEKMETKEIAALLDIDVQTVRSCKHKAVVRLREFYVGKKTV